LGNGCSKAFSRSGGEDFAMSLVEWLLLGILAAVLWQAIRIERALTRGLERLRKDLLDRQQATADELQGLVKRLPFVIEHGTSGQDDPFAEEEANYWAEKIGPDAAAYMLVDQYFGRTSATATDNTREDAS
jgi:hypothetical protein